MECSFQEIIRETKNAVNARLDMLEALINTKKIVTVDMVSNDSIYQNSLHERISTLENIVQNLKSEQIPELIIEKDSRTSFEEPVIKYIQTSNIVNDENTIESEAQQIVSEGEDEEGECEDEGEEGEGEGEDENEGEGEELTEFTYKGMTLYRDSENKVYQADEDGVGDPIGIWDEKTNRIKKLS